MRGKKDSRLDPFKGAGGGKLSHDDEGGRGPQGLESVEREVLNVRGCIYRGKNIYERKNQGLL